MKIQNKNYRTIWPDARCKFVEIIDQTKLPFAFEIVRIDSLEKIVTAIKTMQVRGAPLIGAAAAYGMALAMLEDESDAYLLMVAELLRNSRPTAVNLAWAVSRMVTCLQATPFAMRNFTAWREAAAIAEEDVAQNQKIATHGLALIEQTYAITKNDKNKPFNILTHCNAGWLATVDVGTALAPIYAAHDAGLNIHVWVDETRPRNQGASLTAWELAQHGVPHTVISDNAGGHFMQIGKVDMVIVGADRVANNGDVCNKIGTYLKALAAFDAIIFGHKIPFYVAVPSPTIDWTMDDGSNIEIEQRSIDEVAYMQGLGADGSLQTIRVIPVESTAANPAFDVTPARLVTGIITEHGVFAPNELSELRKAMRTERQQLLKISQQLAILGLNQGTSGNASVRYNDGFLVTPSGMAIENMTADSMVEMQFDGSHKAAKKPSSEWFFHRDILKNRPEINAVIHTHSMFATTLACLRLEIPAFHYMIAVAGGDSIRCAPYALFGTALLSEHALAALQNRKACLLANHGMIALGGDLDDALNVAIEVENLCEQYWRILQTNSKPPLLNHAEMEQVFQQFKGYGKWAR